MKRAKRLLLTYLVTNQFIRGIYFAKYYGSGGGERNGCWGEKMKTEGEGKKNEKKAKRGKGKRRKRA